MEKETTMRKKFRIYFLTTATILVFGLVACSSKPSTTATSNTEATTNTETATYHKKDVTGPAASFDWNAKVEPTNYERTFVETNSGSQFNKTLDRTKEAAENLEKKKKEISDPKVQTALKLVDAVFVNQENFDLVVKSAGASNQEELFDKIWNEYLVPELTKIRPNFSNDTIFEYKGEKYPLKIYAPMFFKVNTNALGKAGAYTLEDYKVEGDLVYLKFMSPAVETYQYEVKASYHTDKLEFFRGMVEEQQKILNTDYAKAMNIRFVYQLAALDFKANNYVDLEGMDYLDRNTHYLAIKVDNNGEASLDNENLANLLQISMKASNEANKGKFE